MSLAIVTGASAVIARASFDLLIAAEQAKMVAEVGFKAMMNGDGDVVSGWHTGLTRSS